MTHMLSSHVTQAWLQWSETTMLSSGRLLDLAGVEAATRSCRRPGPYRCSQTRGEAAASAPPTAHRQDAPSSASTTAPSLGFGRTP